MILILIILMLILVLGGGGFRLPDYRTNMWGALMLVLFIILILWLLGYVPTR